jgi:3-methylfumaryl-CoA hydratase
MMSSVEAVPFAEWIGRRSESEDVVSERLVEGFRATLGPHLAPLGQDEAPLCIHWCLSPAIAAMAELGPDGHPAKNRYMPPVPQPRRMWAGGTIERLGNLMVGDRVRRVTTIATIERKQGRSGELWFVGVDHEYHGPRGLALRERQDIVYREASGQKPSPASPAPSRQTASSTTLDPTTTLLFRYSALTFNGHRIHYDHPYATGVECYEGLVVHGPLQATLLYNMAASALGSAPARFSYRGVAPAIADRPLALCRGGGELAGRFWTQGAAGQIHMEAETGTA